MYNERKLQCPLATSKMALLNQKEFSSVQLHARCSLFECTNMANVIYQSRAIDESLIHPILICPFFIFGTVQIMKKRRIIRVWNLMRTKYQHKVTSVKCDCRLSISGKSQKWSKPDFSSACRELYYKKIETAPWSSIFSDTKVWDFHLD